MNPQPRRVRKLVGTVGLAALLVLAACGDDESTSSTETTEGGAARDVTITLVTHDSFAVSDDVLAAFTKATGIKVRLLKGGDAGTVVNQAVLTKDDPQGDVLFGVDSTFLGRALDADLFSPYEPDELDQVDAQFVVDDEHRVTPIDYGDVCLNYDKAYFEEHNVAPPDSLDDLTTDAYRDLLVVQNPATSSPGLAFLLATIDATGDEWPAYWEALRANGVKVVDDWEAAYYGEFSGGTSSEGDRPIVVSYASSPPAEVFFSEKPIDESPVGVVESSCYRQVEFAGVLRGTEHEDEARAFIDFMLSRQFQEDVPLNMFVFPVVRGAELPEVFTRHAVVPAKPLELDPDDVARNRDDWIKTWTDTVLR